MDRIASFTINHLDLMPGLYVSRRDAKGDCVTTTFDLRITAPNREPVVDTPALHTIEHLAATYLLWTNGLQNRMLSCNVR